MSVSQGFGAVRSSMPWWILGALIERSSNDEIRTALNQHPQAAEVWTADITDPGDDIEMSIVVNGVTVTYDTGTGGDADSIGAGLAAAINAEPLVRGQVTASFDAGTDVLTLTGNTAGQAFTASEDSSGIASLAQSVAADSADPIEFGRAVIRTGFQKTDELVVLAASARFDAQVITITPSGYVAGAILTARVYEVRGAERVLLAEVSETSATDLDTTLDALAAGLNAALPAASVVVAATPATATALTFTAEVGGLEIEAELASDDSGASIPTSAKAYTTGPSEATSFHRAFRGVVMRDHATEATTIGGTETQVPANGALSYVRKGPIAVASAEAITAGADVFVELGVTADLGKFFAAGSATRVAVSRARAVWERDADTNTGSLAALRLL